MILTPPSSSRTPTRPSRYSPCAVTWSNCKLLPMAGIPGRLILPGVRRGEASGKTWLCCATLATHAPPLRSGTAWKDAPISSPPEHQLDQNLLHHVEESIQRSPKHLHRGMQPLCSVAPCESRGETSPARRALRRAFRRADQSCSRLHKMAEDASVSP